LRPPVREATVNHREGSARLIKETVRAKKRTRLDVRLLLRWIADGARRRVVGSLRACLEGVIRSLELWKEEEGRTWSHRWSRWGRRRGLGDRRTLVLVVEETFLHVCQSSGVLAEASEVKEREREERRGERASSPSGSDHCTKRECCSSKREKRQTLCVDQSQESKVERRKQEKGKEEKAALSSSLMTTPSETTTTYLETRRELPEAVYIRAPRRKTGIRDWGRVRGGRIRESKGKKGGTSWEGVGRGITSEERERGRRTCDGGGVSFSEHERRERKEWKGKEERKERTHSLVVPDPCDFSTQTLNTISSVCSSKSAMA
jgi:hypothetical protein